MMSLTDINSRLASIQTGINCIQVIISTTYTYLETLAFHPVSTLLPPPSNLREMLKKLKETWPNILS